MRKQLFIIKAGTTYPDTLREYGDFDLWTIRGLGCCHESVRVIDAEHGGQLPGADDCSSVVVTGSHDMVTDNLPWSVRIADWIPSLVDRKIPFLGICYGHQLLAHAMGGRVGFHSEGTEIGTVEITLLPDRAGDALFSALPMSFPAHVSHSQTVIALPEGAVRIAMNSFEPTHAFRIGECAWGVQFHPEYTADIMRSYIIHEKGDLIREGIDILQIMDSVKDTPVAASILKRFNEIAIMGF